MITRDFVPKDNLIRLPKYVLHDLINKGFSYITLPSGEVIKITKDDVVLKKDELIKAGIIKG